MKTIFYPDECLNDGRSTTANHLAGGGFAATIGFFDGVHQGHRFLIERLKNEAQKRGLQSMVITFERHPRQVLQDEWQPELLTTLTEKMAMMAETGIDMLVVLRFDRRMAALSALDFMQLMKERLRVECLLTGYDNRFGHDRTEGFDDYRRYGKELGIEVVCGDALTVGQQNVSSSRVRRLLSEGRVDEAACCLGRPYSMTGQVVHGEQIGRTIGFPTANMQPDDSKLIPLDGVYAVMTNIEGEGKRKGVMNIGTRPTFDGKKRTLEVNIIDGMGDFYRKTMTVHFIARLRGEQHFPSGEALAAQIEQDKEQAEKILITTN
jgi:riboflavin kinase/FMN adenylyltransferase